MIGFFIFTIVIIIIGLFKIFILIYNENDSRVNQKNQKIDVCKKLVFLNNTKFRVLFYFIVRLF